ncbi:MAG: hypothetical protein ACYDGR_17660 [Candidatus Dormibacteria bacterium]
MRTFVGFATWSGRTHAKAVVVSASVTTLVFISEFFAFKTQSGGTPADRAVFARAFTSLARSFATLAPPPNQVGTVGGYLEWRVAGFLSFPISIYAIIAGAAVVRGSEERGLVEAWLAAGLGRRAMLLGRLAGFLGSRFAALGLVVLGLGLLAIANADLPKPTAIAGAMLVVEAVVALHFCASLFASQLLASRRACTGLVGVWMTLTFVLANLAGWVGGLEALRWISPFYLGYRSHPLLAGGSLDAVGLLALAGGAAAFTALAMMVVELRDVGQPLFRATESISAPRRTLVPYARGLYRAGMRDVAGIIGAWCAGIALFAAVEASVATTVVDGFSGSATFSAFMARLGTARAAFAVGWINFAIFVVGLPMVWGMLTAVAGRWASDQEEGRVEMILAQPVSIGSLLLARASVGATAAVLGVGTLTIAGLGGARLAGLELQHAHPVAAVTLALLACVAFAAIAVALSPRLARVAVGVLSALIGMSFLVDLLGFFLSLPDWLIRLSLLRAYGSPLVDGGELTGAATLAAVVVIGALATVLQARRELSAG